MIIWTTPDNAEVEPLGPRQELHGDDATVDGYGIGIFRDGYGVVIDGFETPAAAGAWLTAKGRTLRGRTKAQPADDTSPETARAYYARGRADESGDYSTAAFRVYLADFDRMLDQVRIDAETGGKPGPSPFPEDDEA